MSGPTNAPGKIVPAQLNFLSIYNPSLGTTDETRQNQVLFYYSEPTAEQAWGKSKNENKDASGNTTGDEQLRQIGLAQGVVKFAGAFSDGEPVESVETEKHRIVLTQLEEGWWIIASINLTRLVTSKGDHSGQSTPRIDTEYSSREVSPPRLLLQQLRQANRIFLLHHGSSLSNVFVRLKRAKFCAILDSFWTHFATTWDVLLHGNPAVDVYGGIKLAVGGELGIGVGEEEWGSGERDVLEGLAKRTSGLVDLTVSRFGEPKTDSQSVHSTNQSSGSKSGASQTSAERWMGEGRYPGPADGMIFSGLGNITRPTLRSLTDWMQWIYVFGERAYGVSDNPGSSRKRRRRKKDLIPNIQIIDESQTAEVVPTGNVPAQPEEDLSELSGEDTKPSSIPQPIVAAAEESSNNATVSASTQQETSQTASGSEKPEKESANPFVNPENWLKYLTLGYGSAWGKTDKVQTASLSEAKGVSEQTSETSEAEQPALIRQETPQLGQKKVQQQTKSPRPRHKTVNEGRYIIGLTGDLDAEDFPSREQEAIAGDDESTGLNSRLVLRTLHVEVFHPEQLVESDSGFDDAEAFQARPQKSSTVRVRVVIYIHPPFMYTFLFNTTATSLSFPSFFHDIHHHLTPLHAPLLKSTSPANVASRLALALPTPPTLTPVRSKSSSADLPLFNLIYSPNTLTLHASIPNIPVPGEPASEDAFSLLFLNSATPALAWTRIDALNVHSQVLNMYADTRRPTGELEQTAKTSKGWWVVWMKVASSAGEIALGEASSTDAIVERDGEDDHNEAILVRKATERSSSRSSWMGISSPSRTSGKSTGAGMSLSNLVGRERSTSNSTTAGIVQPAQVPDGIGLDTRKYIESLLSLNR